MVSSDDSLLKKGVHASLCLSHWFLCEVALADGTGGDGVGRVLGLVETRAPTRAHRLTARRRYLYTARDRGFAAYCRRIGEDDDLNLNRSAAQGVHEKIANVDGVKINYKIGGRGPLVVLLHGYAQTSHMWIPLMPLLAASHTVIAPDLRGAERAKDGYDKKTMAKDIRSLVRQLGYEQVQLVGHDIGLMVAYAYAAQYPKEVSKVVLMDAFLPGIGNWKGGLAVARPLALSFLW